MEQRGTSEEMWRESRDLCKSGKCCAAARGAEEAILMHGGEERWWRGRSRRRRGRRQGEVREGVK